MTFLVSQNKEIAIRSDEITVMYISHVEGVRWKDGDITREPGHILTVVLKKGDELVLGEFASAEKARNALVRVTELIQGGWGCIVEEDEVSE